MAADYLSDIEKVYFGGASKSNAGFVGHSYIAKYDYADQVGVSNLIKILKENEYTKINIDENCVVGWATAYFHMVVKESEECVDEYISCRTAQNPQFAQISSIFRLSKW